MKGHFEVVIRERFVRNLVCPVCSLPDIDNSEQTETHFQFLLLMVREKPEILLPSSIHRFDRFYYFVFVSNEILQNNPGSVVLHGKQTRTFFS